MKQTARRALVLASLTLAACSADAPLGPRDEHATMHVAASGVTATTIGQTLVIDAAVMNAKGVRLQDAEIHWDVSAPGVLESLGGGRFRVLSEGAMQIAAVWPKDPSVRATVTVTVDAGLLASACITKTDQTTTRTTTCANARVVVRVANAASGDVIPLDSRAAVPMTVRPEGGQ